MSLIVCERYTMKNAKHELTHTHTHAHPSLDCFIIKSFSSLRRRSVQFMFNYYLLYGSGCCCCFCCCIGCLFRWRRCRGRCGRLRSVTIVTCFQLSHVSAIVFRVGTLIGPRDYKISATFTLDYHKWQKANIRCLIRAASRNPIGCHHTIFQATGADTVAQWNLFRHMRRNDDRVGDWQAIFGLITRHPIIYCVWWGESTILLVGWCACALAQIHSTKTWFRAQINLGRYTFCMYRNISIFDANFMCGTI